MTIESTSTVDANDDLRDLGRSWWLITLFGVITVAFGVVFSVKPSSSVHTIAVIFGIWLLILGVLRMIQAIGATGERLEYLAVGLLAMLMAILLLHHTTTTVAVLGFIVGIFWTLGGIAEMIHGFGAGGSPVNWLTVLAGVVALVVGLLCLAYPSLSLSILCVIVGIGLVVYGIVEIVLGFRIRRLR